MASTRYVGFRLTQGTLIPVCQLAWTVLQPLRCGAWSTTPLSFTSEWLPNKIPIRTKPVNCRQCKRELGWRKSSTLHSVWVCKPYRRGGTCQRASSLGQGRKPSDSQLGPPLKCSRPKSPPNYCSPGNLRVETNPSCHCPAVTLHHLESSLGLSIDGKWQVSRSLYGCFCRGWKRVSVCQLVFTMVRPF